MNFTEAVDYLFSLGNEILAMKLGLAAMEWLLARLGDPHRGFRSILVAGTNGKGSTSACLASVLDAAGLKTGLFTSPHLIRATERIRIGDEEISPERFGALIGEVRAAADELIETGRLPARPTFFEHLAAAAFLYFLEERVDVAVLEVGLGGRLDATNIVTPDIAVIASIGYDHQEYLGTTLTEIAGEKAAIIRPGARAFVSARQLPEAEEALRDHIKKSAARADWVGPLPVAGCDATGALRFAVGGREIQTALRGRHQAHNAGLAVAVAREFLGKSEATERAVASGLASVRWRGRLELIPGTPPVLLDGAHNPQGAETLAEFLENDFARRPVTLVFAAMRDKPVRELLSPLARLVSRFIATEVASSPRTLSAATLAGVAREIWSPADVIEEKRLPDALALAREVTPPDGAILVSGSLYLVGEAVAFLELEIGS
jgi:dihydrofolate synthase / folylpolyglutamate synthase